MTTFTCRHTFDVDIDTFWSKIFFDREYNTRLYEEGLGFGYEIERLEDLGGGRMSRSVRTEPRLEAPAVVKKLIGDGIKYVERGELDVERRVWKFTVVPTKLADKIDIAGEYWVEPRGDKVERVVRTTIDVKVFGVGKAIEAFIEKSTRDSYEKAAAFTNRYLKEKGLAR